MCKTPYALRGDSISSLLVTTRLPASHPLHPARDGAARRAAQATRRRDHNGAINAIIDGADDVDIGVDRGDGPLAGVTLTVKANIAQRGRVLSAASRVLDGYRAVRDATCVARAKAAGAVVVGTTNMDEFGMGSSTEHSPAGPTVNPWASDRSAGGSSGGAAAAVAAGFCDAALGTDTGGSVRQPAAFCGVVGFKPSYGRVSRQGVVAYASSLDQVGVIAGDVDTAAVVFGAIAGVDHGDMNTVTNPLGDLMAGPKTGLRVGVLRSLFESDAAVSDDVKAAVVNAADAFRAAGAVATDIDDSAVAAAHHAVAAYYVIATAEASSNLSRYDGVRYGPRGADNAASGDIDDARALFGDEVKRRILLGTFVLSSGYYDAYLRQAQKVRAVMTAGLLSAFANVDVLLLPTTPTPAFRLGEKLSDPLAMYAGDLFTLPASLAGLPAISVPVGLSSSSPALPLAVQLIGRPYDESTLLSAARVVAAPLTPPTRLGATP